MRLVSSAALGTHLLCAHCVPLAGLFSAKCLPWAASLGFLWFTLIRHLSIEWSLNPQYAYGWAVPPLCAWLLWRQTSRQPGTLRRHVRAFPLSILAIFALCYAPARLIAEANPDWRLVSWLLAIVVLGISVSASRFLLPDPLPVFPCLFFLTAVPWPTPIEVPVVNTLTAAVARAAAELLALAGVPSLLQANLIQTTGGIAAIAPGCSGIRSVQVSLMLALFLGEFYQLTFPRRILCGFLALLLSILLNLGRTVTLSLCLDAAWNFNAWHQAAGICIPLASFLLLWWAAHRLRSPHAAISTQLQAPTPGHLAIPPSKRLAGNLGPALALVLWVFLVELATIGWYRFHEQSLPSPVRWRVAVPQLQSACRQLGMSQDSSRILRFDDALNLAFEGPGELRCQLIYLQWNPGRTAARLAHNHTPSDCLIAAGAELLSQSEIKLLPAAGLLLPFRAYTARTQTGIIHLFYCLWEDRAPGSPFAGSWLTYRSRLDSVLAGRRNSGQRALQFAVWGAPNETQAEAALRELLPKMIHLEP